MLPLETKQSGGKILPQLDLQGGVFLEEASRNSLQNIQYLEILIIRHA